MPGRGAPTFLKRQKEQKRAERAQAKRAAKQARRENRLASAKPEENLDEISTEPMEQEQEPGQDDSSEG